MFRGLFIGVDRYASPGINWLSCARRDAMALHGLFSDSIGGEAALLTDAEATVAAIQEGFQRLAAAETDDVVMIAFSGHGTDTHEIVAYDTDAQDVAGTSIPLTALGEWCARIRARRLLVILDCSLRRCTTLAPSLARPVVIRDRTFCLARWGAVPEPHSNLMAYNKHLILNIWSAMTYSN
jgi:hypothetical protein